MNSTFKKVKKLFFQLQNNYFWFPLNILRRTLVTMTR